MIRIPRTFLYDQVTDLKSQFGNLVDNVLCISLEGKCRWSLLLHAFDADVIQSCGESCDRCDPDSLLDQSHSAVPVPNSVPSSSSVTTTSRVGTLQIWLDFLKCDGNILEIQALQRRKVKTETIVTHVLRYLETPRFLNASERAMITKFFGVNEDSINAVMEHLSPADMDRYLTERSSARLSRKAVHISTHLPYNQINGGSVDSEISGGVE